MPRYRVGDVDKEDGRFSVLSASWSLQEALPFVLFLLGLVAGYVVFLMIGLFKTIGFAYFYGSSETLRVAAGLNKAFPVYLEAGQSVDAVFDSDADFGSLALSIKPSTIANRRSYTSRATIFVKGDSEGRARFTASEASWYFVRARSSVLHGPDCLGDYEGALEALFTRECPAYRLSASVRWEVQWDRSDLPPADISVRAARLDREHGPFREFGRAKRLSEVQ
ncbi:MAG: hypothetical protein AAGM38_09590 [Pseudomonadota bacterium]